MNTYTNYKPSGIDWLGNVPAHWELKKLKYVATIISGAAFDSSKFCKEGNVRVLKISNIQHDYIDWEDTEYLPDDYASDFSRFRIFNGDIIFALTRPIISSGIKSARAFFDDSEQVFLNQRNAVLRVSEHVNDIFLYYVTHSQHFFSFFENSIDNTGQQPNISPLAIANFVLPFPPLAEQAEIVTYLDEQTAQLDGLIARKRRLMALLREEKAALINEAVTKGIRPNVPTKPSGIGWLGNVPVHWEVKKLKHVATVRSGFALNASTVIEGGIKIPYLRVANVQDGYLKLKDVTEVYIDPTVAERYLLKAGDLLMNEGGDNDKLGRGCVWNGELNPCLHQNHVFAVRMNEGVNVEWINALTTTTYARQYFMLNCKQSTNLASISQTNIRELPVIIPPTVEEIDILTYLDTETAKIDYTVARIEREIELMQEYRTALISEVVTGKVKVV